MNMLAGKKTYIVAFAMLVVGVVEMLTGDATGWAMIAENAEIILVGLGLSGLRNAK